MSEPRFRACFALVVADLVHPTLQGARGDVELEELLKSSPCHSPDLVMPCQFLHTFPGLLLGELLRPACAIFPGPAIFL